MACMLFLFAAVAMLGSNAAAFGPTPGCDATAQFPCLPGIDAVGIGYDAVKGTSFGVGLPVIQFNYTNPANVWNDPFGNKTSYNYADQARVMQRTTQSTSHAVYRSVEDYVSQQQTDAHVSAHAGMFFKASVDTNWAKSTMQDSLHIVAESESELGVYTITLNPPMLLEPHPTFQKYIDSLPEAFDAAIYQRFIDYFGTHYIYAATLGGKARMKTVISHDYFSTQSDSSIVANLQVTWGAFGGGGGGGSSSKTTDQKWKDSCTSSTTTEGGDPSIKSFNSASEWSQWANSVDVGSPVVTSVALEPISSMITDEQKRNNVVQAVQAYASNVTFPAADLSKYAITWCDCYEQGPWADHLHYGCSKQGFFVSNLQYLYSNGLAVPHSTCCRPCFTAQN